MSVLIFSAGPASWWDAILSLGIEFRNRKTCGIMRDWRRRDYEEDKSIRERRDTGRSAKERHKVIVGAAELWTVGC